MLFFNKTAKSISAQVLERTESTIRNLNIPPADDIARGFLYGWFCYSLLAYGHDAKSFTKVGSLIQQHIDSLGQSRAKTLALTFASTLTKLSDTWETPPIDATDFLTKHMSSAFAFLYSHLNGFDLETDSDKMKFMSILINEFHSFIKIAKR